MNQKPEEIMQILCSEVANVYGTATEMVDVFSWLKQTCSPMLPKKNRPALMPHGNFHRRQADAITRHSGLIQIDIDAKENPHVKDWAHARDLMGKQPHVLCSSISASGAGIFILVMVDREKRASELGIEMKAWHRTQAATAIDYIESCWEDEGLGLVNIDTKVANNLASLRFMASDENLWVNVDCTPISEA